MFRASAASHHPRPDAGVRKRKRAAPVFATGWKSRESLSAARRGDTDMATAIQKITLSASRDIPFNKLVLSQANVRRVKAGVSIEELAEDIARRTLLQGLSVRPILDAEGQETGMFEVPAGGRRYRALELLVKQKRLAKTAPVPCVVREPSTDVSADEDSLAENVQRVALHPLDQFRAFQALRDKGLGEEEIAARFFVTPTVVKQRLRLAAVSGKLLDVYAEDGMTLEQFMAFTVTNDHARQEQVWEGCLAPTTRSLTSSAASSPKALSGRPTGARNSSAPKPMRPPAAWSCATSSSMTMAAGCRTRRCSIGWSSRSSRPRPRRLRAEGWKWIAVACDFPYGHTAGLRRLTGETVELTDEEDASLDRAQGRTRRARGAICRGRRTARRGRSAPRRNRDRALRRSRTGPSATIRPRSPAPASSSASTARARCASSAASSGPRTRRRLNRPRVATTEGGGERGGRRHGGRRAAGGHHHRRCAGQSRSGGGRRGRDDPSAVGSSGDRADRPSDPRAARRRGERSACRLPGGPACALPPGLLPLRARHLPGDHGEAFGLQRPGAGPGGHRRRPRRSRRGTPNGAGSCPRRRPICGTL